MTLEGSCGSDRALSNFSISWIALFDPKERQHEGAAGRELTAFLLRRNIVLLGDPGAGNRIRFENWLTRVEGSA
jgi:hypothetical protein